MNILLTNHTLSVGGVRTFMLSLSKALHSLGHRCELFFFGARPLEQYVPAGHKAHFGDLAACLRLIKNEGFEVVHANNMDWVKGVSAARNLGAKLIVTSHGRVRPGNWTFGWSSSNCDAFTTCSKWLAETLQPYTDLPVKAVLNGIDTSRFKPTATANQDARPAAARPIVAWVGRGVDLNYKRIDKFAALAPLLHRANLRLWVADPGGPKEVAEIAPDAARALLPVVDFWDKVPAERMPAFYQDVVASGGCVISTSQSEGLPLTLLEAQASGCPVIGADVRGVNECVFPEHGGVLYPFEMEAGQVADVVVDVLRDQHRWRERSAAGARYVREHFSIERMASEYCRVYEESPYPLRANFAQSLKTRLRLSPLLHWSDYVKHRWAVGRHQFEISQKMAERGEWTLASSAARASLLTSPTLYLRPQRVAHFLKAQWRRRATK